MKDFLKKYHKKEQRIIISTILGAFVLALGVNMVMFDSTNIGNQMKASILESNSQSQLADIVPEISENHIFLKNGTTMNQVQDLSLSIVFNPEVLDIKNITSPLGEVTILGEKNDGILNLLVSQEANTILPKSPLFDLEIEKKSDTSTQLNILNANFTDSETQSYELSTSGITF